MNVNKLGNVVCLVITGELDPSKITAQRVIDQGIVTKEESCQIETRRLDSSMSVFTIAHSIDVLCSKERLQVSGSGDVSDRIPSITHNLLQSSGFVDIESVGVNAVLDFTFNSPEDSLQFGNFFVPLHFWQDFLRDGRVVEFSMGENKRQVFPDYTKSFNIHSLRARELPDGRKVASVRMSVNYDYRLDALDDCYNVINNSLSLFEEFWQESDRIISLVK